MEPKENKTIYGQLAAAQAQFRSAVKDSSNPHFKSKYADLASIWDACREGLATQGLFVTQPIVGSESGWYVHTKVYNAAGEFIESEMPIISDMKNPQTFGSALTYARRYSLAAILGIVTDDDDAEVAMNRSQHNNEPRKSPASTPRYDRPADGDTRTKAQTESRLISLRDDILSLLSNALFTEEERRKSVVTVQKSTDPDALQKMLATTQKVLEKRMERAGSEMERDMDRKSVEA